MTTFMTSLSILAFKSDIVINTVNIDSVCLSEDCNSAPEPYSEEKKRYIKSKQLQPKIRQKWKDSYKELEQMFSNHRCIHVQWSVHDPVLLFFNSGAMAAIQLDHKKLAIEKIVIDNSLCGKLCSDHITDVLFSENCVLISYSEPKLTYVHFSKNSPSFPNKLLGHKKSKIVGFDPHINNVDLPGSSSRRLEKKLSMNNMKDCVLIWWCFTSTDVWPWMPSNQSIDRFNILVYSLNGNSFDILCSAKVHGELQHASFSKWHSNRILTLEEVSDGDQYSVNICTYEVSRGRCQCISLLKLPLQSHITAFDWAPSEDKLLLSDQDMSLFAYDLNSNTTLVTSTIFVAKEIAWHPDGTIACVIGENGSLQCFDAALTQFKFQMSREMILPMHSINLHSMLYPQKIAQKIMWQNSNMKQSLCGVSNAYNVSDTLLVYFETGILIFIKFSLGCITKNALTPLELISQYLKCDSLDESVCLLQGLNWCQQSEVCFQCLSKIANFLLRKPFNLRIESAIQLSLGTFYDSVSMLPETVLNEYHQQVDHIARRFFHQLLRNNRFEKAYLLAVNLQSRNLFLDLYHVAKKKEMMLAIVSLKHAEQLDVSSGSSSEQSDSTNGNECSSASSVEAFSTVENQTLRTSQSSVTAYPAINNEMVYNKGTFSLNDKDIKKKLQVSNETNTKPDINSTNTSLVFNYLYKRRHLDSADLDIYDKAAHDVSKQHEAAQLCSDFKHGEILCCQSNTFSESDVSPKAIKSNSVRWSETFEEEEEDLEGAQVKFVHFGIV